MMCTVCGCPRVVITIDDAIDDAIIGEYLNLDAACALRTLWS